MIELQGRYNKDCKIFTDIVEDEAIQEIYEILSRPEHESVPIRIMPDVCAAPGVVVGFTMPFGNYINPSHVGGDIGCTISSTFFSGPLSPDKYALFEMRVRKEIPVGFEINKTRKFEMKDFLKFMRSYSVPFNSEKDIESFCKRIGMDLGIFYKSIGTLGSGNHFMEYDESDGHYAFTVHTGSRHLGQKLFKYWQNKANKNKLSKDGERKAIEEGKARGLSAEEALKEVRLSIHPGYLSGEDLVRYLDDVRLACAYAAYNHKVIHEQVTKIYEKIAHAKAIDFIQTTHNYIYGGIIRKGAVSAEEGERILIPFNMRDGIAVCTGKGNPDWNWSAPHGAGRIMSRSKAKDTLSLEQYQEEMKDVYSTSVSRDTLDESPMAYKSIDDILPLIDPTCTVNFLMKPKINIKAGV